MRLTLVLVILFATPVFGYTISQEEFLKSYFAGQTYKTETLINLARNKGDLILATGVQTGVKKWVRNAVVFAVDHGNVKMYLQIVGPVILGELGTVLSDVSGVARGFWAWELLVETPYDKNTRLGIGLSIVSDSGTGLTDHLPLLWDEKSEAFKILKVDPSEY